MYRWYISHEHAFPLHCHETRFSMCVLVGVYVMSLCSIELCAYNELFLLMFIKLYARQRDDGTDCRGAGIERSVAPIVVPFCGSTHTHTHTQCRAVAKPRIQHVHTFCWANKFRLCFLLLNKLRWPSKLRWISTLCMFALPLPQYITCPYSYGLLKFVYIFYIHIFLANNAAATG